MAIVGRCVEDTPPQELVLSVESNSSFQQGGNTRIIPVFTRSVEIYGRQRLAWEGRWFGGSKDGCFEG